MTDLVRLHGLRVVGRHGVLAEEKQRAQPFEVDIDMELASTEAGRTDDLADTVDYGYVAARVAEIVGSENFELLERLGERLADELLEDPLLAAVTVEVRKLRPPVPVDLAWAGVRIRRGRT